MAASQAIADIGGIVGIAGSLFGSSGSQSGSQSGSSIASQDSTSTTTKRLDISDVGIEGIIRDVLGGAGGLKDIFSGEQNAGIFNSSVAAQASGDLASKLVSEIARLTASEQVTTDAHAEQKAESKSSSKSKTKDGGVLGAIKNIF